MKDNKLDDELKGPAPQTKKKETGAKDIKRKTPKVTFKKSAPPVLYTKETWKGVRDVYMCVECNHCEDLEDDMKLHVITHFPKKEQQKQLDLLTR